MFASLPLGAGLRPVGADTIGSLLSQAATVSQRLVLEQLQVDTTRQETSVVSAEVAADTGHDQLNQQLAADQHDLAQHLHVVQSQAIQSYIDSGADSSSGDTTLFAGGSSRAQAASAYASLAVGNITTQMDQLHTAQHALQAQESALQARQAQDRAERPDRPRPWTGRPPRPPHCRPDRPSQPGNWAPPSPPGGPGRAAAAAVARAPGGEAGTTSATAPRAHRPPSRPLRPGAPRHPRGRWSRVTPTNLADPALNSFLTCVVQAESGGDCSIGSPRRPTALGAFPVRPSPPGTQQA